MEVEHDEFKKRDLRVRIDEIYAKFAKTEGWRKLYVKALKDFKFKEKMGMSTFGGKKLEEEDDFNWEKSFRHSTTIGGYLTKEAATPRVVVTNKNHEKNFTLKSSFELNSKEENFKFATAVDMELNQIRLRKKQEEDQLRKEELAKKIGKSKKSKLLSKPKNPLKIC